MYKKLWLFLLILTVIASLVILLPNPSIHYESTVTEHIEPIPEPLAVLHPALIPVCACESAFKKNGVPQQFEADGVTVRFGRINPLDTGMCQINQKYHLANAIKMGLDIFTEQGNIKYANYLYEKNGLKDWGWSKHCWQ